MRKQTLLATIAFIAITFTLFGEMTYKEFGNSGNRFIATEQGTGAMLTSFTVTMDIEILSLSMHTAQATTDTVVVVGEFNVIARGALVSNPLTAHDYTYVNYDLGDLTTGTTMIWPSTTDANHYYLEKEDYLDLTIPLLTTATVWGLEIFYERR